MKSIDDLPKPLEFLAGGVLLLGFILVIVPLHLFETSWGIVRQAVGPHLARAATVAIVVGVMGISVAGTLLTSMREQLSTGGEVVLCSGTCGYMPMLDVLGPWPVALVVAAVIVVGYNLTRPFRARAEQ